MATPAVRRLCRELFVDTGKFAMKNLTGSGAGGRILKGDVLAYAAANGISIPRGIVNAGDDALLNGQGLSSVEAPSLAPHDDSPFRSDHHHPTPSSSGAFERNETEHQPPLLVGEQRPVKSARGARASVSVPIRGETD